jgi:hypothetical protein
VLAEFVEWALFLMIPALLVGGVLALVVSAMSNMTAARDAFIRVVGAGLALMLAVDSLLLIPYARGEDTYYGGGVTRWEHADRGGSTFLIGAAIVGAWLTGGALGWIALTRDRPRIRPLVGLAAAASCLLLVIAWFMLTGGH